MRAQDSNLGPQAMDASYERCKDEMTVATSMLMVTMVTRCKGKNQSAQKLTLFLQPIPGRKDRILIRLIGGESFIHLAEKIFDI